MLATFMDTQKAYVDDDIEFVSKVVYADNSSEVYTGLHGRCEDDSYDADREVVA
jgi:hypothetical protein